MFRIGWAALAALFLLSLPVEAQTQCEYRSSTPTLQNRQRITPLCDVNGQLKITGGTGGGGSGTASSSVAVVTSVNSVATSTQLVASNSSRIGLVVENTDANDAYIKFGTTASLTSFTVRIPAGGSWEMPAAIYTGRVDIIWAADGAGLAAVTEF